MCGIFSWSGLRPGVFNRDKFDKLGIQNETRGKHSCGITIDGDIYIGADTDTKLYRDFIAANNDIEDPKRYPSVIGHTRHATVGAHTADNAHPFGFGSIRGENNRNDYAFVGVHNGSLLNHKELAIKYGIELKTKSSSGNWQRDKIDSEILLEILYKTKNFKVLSEYNGAAALKWTFLEEPDVVYYYHGKSSEKEGDVIKKEERPLWYYKQEKNSLYASSLPDSLKTIGAVENETLGEFKHNTVYKVTNGDIENAELFSISRADNYQKHGGVKKTGKSTTTGTTTKKDTTNLPHNKSSQACRVSNSKKFSESKNIYHETPAKGINSYGGNVYMNKLRYWRNGHRINGFWVFIETFGFYELGEKLKDAEQSFWSLVGKVFIKGEFKNADSLTDDELNVGWIPFPNNRQNPIVNPPIETFFDGIRVESPKDLVGCQHMEQAGRGFDAATLSICSKHPVIDINYSEKDANNQEIYFGGELCSDTVVPLGSERVYDIVEGNLVDFEEIVEPKETTDLVKEVEEMEKAEETKFLEQEASSAKPNYIDDDFMDNYLRKVFDTPVENLKKHKKELQHYLPNQQAQRAIRLIEYVENCVRNILELEEKE